MQVAPKDGISNFCEWLSGFGPQCPIWFTWDKLQPYLPIFFGALVVGGIVWFFWPQSRTQKSELALRLREIEAQEVTAAAMQRHAEALESQDSSSVLNRMRARFDLEGRINAEKELAGESRAKLIISGPHRLKDSKYISQVYWRMRAYNDGPAAAANVQMKLRCGAPGPKDANWSGDYPYPVVPVGFTPDVPSLPINPKDDDNYEIICGWKSDAGIFFTNLDTKSGGHRPIQIGPDER